MGGAQTRLRGSCLCGNFRFEIAGPIQFLKNCHCSQCRKMSGGSFATYARAATKDLRVLCGAEDLITYERRPGNWIAFCRTCGSLVPYPPPGSASLEFGAGLLDDDPGVGVAYEIYLSSRAAWIDVHEQVPQFDAMGSWEEAERAFGPRRSKQ